MPCTSAAFQILRKGEDGDSAAGPGSHLHFTLNEDTLLSVHFGLIREACVSVFVLAVWVCGCGERGKIQFYNGKSKTEARRRLSRHLSPSHTRSVKAKNLKCFTD